MSTFAFFASPPSPALAPFVELIWGVRGTAGWRREVVTPNGVVELMINFGPTQKVVAYGERSTDQGFRDAWLAGVQDQSLTIASPEGSDHLGIRFRPGGAHAFFEIPMDALRNQVVDLDLLLGATARELRDRLRAVPTDQARARTAERWLLDRRLAVHPYHATVRRALEMIQQSGFRARIGDLCESLGLSNRHLIEQFRRVTGLTPKTASRIVRFNAVLRAAALEPEVDWARHAFRFNYADQSHLIREFRHFAGVTPEEYMRRRTPAQPHLIKA